MQTSTYDMKIIESLPLLANEEKKTLLQTINAFLKKPHNPKAVSKSKFSTIDYAQYNYNISGLKIDRNEINER